MSAAVDCRTENKEGELVNDTIGSRARSISFHCLSANEWKELVIWRSHLPLKRCHTDGTQTRSRSQEFHVKYMTNEIAGKGERSNSTGWALRQCRERQSQLITPILGSFH